MVQLYRAVVSGRIARLHAGAFHTVNTLFSPGRIQFTLSAVSTAARYSIVISLVLVPSSYAFLFVVMKEVQDRSHKPSRVACSPIRRASYKSNVMPKALHGEGLIGCLYLLK